MPLKITLVAVLASAMLCLSAMPSSAADLAVADHRIERLFAGQPVPTHKVYVKEEEAGPFIPFVYAPGIYGRIGDFGQRNYYGTSLWDIYSRLPYWCVPSQSGTC